MFNCTEKFYSQTNISFEIRLDAGPAERAGGPSLGWDWRPGCRRWRHFGAKQQVNKHEFIMRSQTTIIHRSIKEFGAHHERGKGAVVLHPTWNKVCAAKDFVARKQSILRMHFRFIHVMCQTKQKLSATFHFITMNNSEQGQVRPNMVLFGKLCTFVSYFAPWSAQLLWNLISDLLFL